MDLTLLLAPNPLTLPVRIVLFNDNDYLAAQAKVLIEDRPIPVSLSPAPRSGACRAAQYRAAGVELTSEARGLFRLAPKSDLAADRLDCELRISLQAVSGDWIEAPSFLVSGPVIRDLQIVPESVSLRFGPVRGERGYDDRGEIPERMPDYRRLSEAGKQRYYGQCRSR